MALTTLLLVASLSLAPATAQQKPGRDRAQVVTPSKEQIDAILKKRKALRSRVDVRRQTALTRLETSRKAFESRQQATLEAANRKTLERIKVEK